MCFIPIFNISNTYTIIIQYTSNTPSPTHLLGRVGDSWAKVWDNYFLIAPLQCMGSKRVLTLESLPQGYFLLRRAGQRA